jgi:hypothetical protein
MARSTTKLLWPGVKVSGRRGAAFIFGDFTLGSSGAIASTTGFFSSAAAGKFGLVKTAGKTGRYTFTTDRKYRTLRVISLDFVGPADTAITGANTCFARNVSGNGFDVQLAIALNAGGTTDTDGMSGLVVSYMIQVETYGGKS